MKWNDPESLQALCVQLVEWESKTGTKGERQFPFLLKKKLQEIPYFQANPAHMQEIDAGKDRTALTAFYQTDKSKDTIVLISHFDTVHTKEYGEMEKYACQPYQLEAALKERAKDLPKEVREDLLSGDYLFGRGTMDMKMGLALHMALIEKASTEKWPINLVLVTVPDEEVNSDGMRAAVAYLADMQRGRSLDIKLFLNSEPSFSQVPNDPSYYIYSGTIGKLMPATLSYGIETHAGESLNGLNAHYMNAFIMKEMEFSQQFQESVYEEKTPLPTCLKVIDLKEDYSTQTSHHVASFYNVQVMKQTAEDIMHTFRQLVSKATENCMQAYEEVCRKNGMEPLGKIDLLSFEELSTYALNKYGQEKLDKIVQAPCPEEDDRLAAAKICDRLMATCKELAPAIILFYAPPYYPAVNSSNDKVVQGLIQLVQENMHEKFGKEAHNIHYFNGICDLSYVNYHQEDTSWKKYAKNCPLWKKGYSIPFEAMQELQAPVFNLGPYGKDAHKMTERLHRQSAFLETPILLEKIVQNFLRN